MMKALNLLLIAAVATLSCACWVKDYPRDVSTIEKGLTNLGYGIDKVGVEVIPRYNIGREYPIQRQTPKVEYSYYVNKAFKLEPELFYPEPEGMPEVLFDRVMAENRRIEVDLIRWRSQYWPQNPDFAIRYEKYVQTQYAYGIYAHAKRPNKAALIISHDWVGDDITRIWRDYDLLDYVSMGFDVVLIQQPYHGMRALSNMAFSGEYFLSGEVSRINEAMCQSVTDIRSMINWLGQNHQMIGLKGIGLGGTTSMMSAVVDDDVDFVIAWLPQGSMADSFELSPQAPFVLRGVNISGLDEDAIRKIVWVSSPANYRPRVSTENVLIVAGMGDQFVPPEQIEKIERKWGDLQIYWYAGGHLRNFQKGKCKKQEYKFLNRQLARVKSVK